jgi:Family of unknown function (DUF5989)
MALFGLWHAATATFILWGIYHGLLLVIHRLGQQIKQRLAVARSTPIGNLLSWAATFSMVSLGWIFFRANDLEHALLMLGSLRSAEAYGRLSLPPSSYLLIPSVILGYFSYETARSVLTRWGEDYHTDASLPAGGVVAVELVQLLRARVWWWFAPLCLVTALVAGIKIFEENLEATPFMYTLF